MNKRNTYEKNILYVVIPSYNEEEVIETSANILLDILNNLIENKKISSLSKILFIDDGSKDTTYELILKLHEQNKMFTGIKLSRNKGHQIALLAGLKEASKYADTTISIDCDLQDDPNAIVSMIDKYNEGFEIVYGVRNARKSDSFLKRTTAKVFYKFMMLMGVESIYNHADTRLLSSTALSKLLEYGEKNLYIRGIIPQIGYKSTKVYYDRSARLAGKSKYGIRKMFALANDGITSFSVRPLKLITFLGVLIFLTAFLFSCCFSVINLSYDIKLLICIILFMFGTIILSIGILGEYLGKIYIESKNRPLYFLDESLLDEEIEE